MNPIHGLLLGIVQGLTEFLPISSSAHLIIVPWLVGWPPHQLAFDVALHMGTLAAVGGYFWRDWLRLAWAWLPGNPPAFIVSTPREMVTPLGAEAEEMGAPLAPAEQKVQDRRIGLSLVIATIPAAIIGAIFADVVEQSLRAPVLIGLTMAAAAILLAAADRVGVRLFGLERIGPWQALAIGVAQAVALAPGVSRSGITLAAALFLGLRREDAARFAFLMATPITAGAGVFQLRHLVRTGIPADERLAVILGIASSLVVGVLAIGGLLRYLRDRNLDVFVVYRLALALIIFGIAFLRGS